MQTSNAETATTPRYIQTRDFWHEEDGNHDTNAFTTAVLRGTHTAWGRQLASQTLVAEVVAKFQSKAPSDFRHGARAGSVSLCERFTNHAEGAEEGAFEYHRPTQSQLEGDLLKMMLTLLLKAMSARGHMQNMVYMPKQSTDVDELHAKNWRVFKGWGSKSPDQQTEHLRKWLLHKFSMDKQGKRMDAIHESERKPRNNAQWEGFEMKDAELEGLVEQVMLQYRQAVGVLQQFAQPL